MKDKKGRKRRRMEKKKKRMVLKEVPESDELTFLRLPWRTYNNKKEEDKKQKGINPRDENEKKKQSRHILSVLRQPRPPLAQHYPVHNR